MRKLILLVVCLLTLSFTGTAQEQQKEVQPVQVEDKDTLRPYQKSPKLPAFNIQLMDSVTIFNTYNIPKGKKTILMLFFPDCKHCKRTIKNLISGMDSLKDVQFYLTSSVHSMTDVKKFYEEHHLADFDNIKVVGRDFEFFFFGFYGTRTVPALAIYDENKKFLKLFEGETTVKQLYEYTHK
jgi:thioredoxin-related protein